MHITTYSFKKAAKRLAAKHSLSLNTTQESLAEAFGFGNFDAALKSLSDSSKPKTPPGIDALLGSVRPHASLGLDGPQTVGLIKAIAPQESNLWQESSFALLHMVVRDLFIERRKTTITANDLRLALRLESLEQRCFDDIRACKTLSPENSATDQPNAEIDAYVRMLPGYRVDRLGMPNGNQAATEHHNHITRLLVSILYRIERLEKPGMLSAADFAMLQGSAKRAYSGCSESRKWILDLVERCEFA